MGNPYDDWKPNSSLLKDLVTGIMSIVCACMIFVFMILCLVASGD